MNDLVQSAIHAANQDDKNKAIELLKQALTTNPNDLEALLTLASFVDEPTRKRKVLNRILSVDATNKSAREMLLEMDRAELNSYRSQTTSSSTSAAPSQSALSSPQQTSASGKSSSVFTEKPIVFRYSVGWLVVLYLFTTFFCCIGLLVASQNIGNSLPSLALAFLFGISALSLSSKVEVKETGIRTSSLFGSAEMKWDDIASIKSNSMQRKLELISNKGKSVKVSTQVKGYAVIVELLRQKRPDLFGQAMPAPMQPSLSIARVEEAPSTGNQSVRAPMVSSFTGTRTFQKSFLKQYGLLFVLIPFFLMFVWLGFESADTKIAFWVTAGFCALLTLIPFFQVGTVKVEPNRLIIESFFEEKEFSAHQIKEIKMQSVRGRYGRVTNFVNIIPVEGKKYPLGGFSEGEELIYGFLMNWLNTYRSR